MSFWSKGQACKESGSLSLWFLFCNANHCKYKHPSGPIHTLPLYYLVARRTDTNRLMPMKFAMSLTQESYVFYQYP